MQELTGEGVESRIKYPSQLSLVNKPTKPFPRSLSRHSRRQFLVWSSRIAAMLAPSCFRRTLLEAFPGPQFDQEGMNAIRTDYRLKPHYRLQSPLDEVALAIQPGLDAFLAEKDAEEIEAVLEKWSQALRRSPWDFEVIKEFLSPEIKATSLRPTEEHSLRSDPGVQIWRKGFSPHPVLGQEEFLRELPSLVAPSLKLTTADFRLESILVSEQSPTLISTRVCYELVGSLSGHSREQRIGHWELDWEKNREGILSIRRWQALEETRSLVKGPGFRDITAQVLGQNSSYAAHLLRGTDDWRTVLDVACGIDIYGNNGIALGDIDNDEYDDLYVCQPAGLPNRLYRNRRDGTFEDITEMAGVGVIDNTASALFVDVDNDGHQDLIVVRASGPLLFLNQGGGKFVFKRDAFRFSQPPQGVFTSAAAADYDRDGWLDIYLCTYIYYQGQEQYRFPVPYHDAQNGPPNFLFRNNRDGSFSDVTAATKLTQNNNRYSFACGWCDFNEDGWPDLYVANDFGRKNLYLNNAGETFSDIAAEAGVEDFGAGMSVSWFDYDNDGKQDLYVGNMWSEAGKRITVQKPFMEKVSANIRSAYEKHANGNSLFRNQGDGSFQDTSRTAGVEMGRWSWSSDAWDFDHDGYPDLYIATGMVSGPNRKDLSSFFWRQVVAHSPLEATPSPNYEQGWNAINELIRSDWTWSGYERNVFYANNRDGTFSDVSGAVGLDLSDDARAFALADFDHDGRLEVFLKNRNAPQLRILHNELEHVGSAIAFRLRGRKSNRDAIGAVVTIETKEGHQVRSLQAGSGFLSQHTKELLFGLGASQGPVNVKVRWPSGLVEFFEQVPLGHRVEIEEGSGHFRAQPFQAKTQFKEAAEPSSGPLSSGFGTWLIEPLAAPDFALPDLDGQIHRLSSFRGRPVLLNFWATWSPACHAELEVLREHHAEWACDGSSSHLCQCQ